MSTSHYPKVIVEPALAKALDLPQFRNCTPEKYERIAEIYERWVKQLRLLAAAKRIEQSIKNAQ
jgi:hypothetical protein